ncbi:hypothetical protein E2C01_089971 [Portunus trituberculatus]|uniref:Uncharacterized protein n=1 Tax=Portunus trituberculatus TaxID=210409 RepID=A0A5B7JKP2_PORTR|nr:hypothetical protein [Portunus trituberculatus]
MDRSRATSVVQPCSSEAQGMYRVMVWYRVSPPWAVAWHLLRGELEGRGDNLAPGDRAAPVSGTVDKGGESQWGA